MPDLVVYELHVGTFSPEGTFAGVEQRLPYLRSLGVTAIELMPVGDFPGSRNWGYDGVALFAPARCYGTPEDLRRLVDAAHRIGLAVLLDVVYNHVGPDGAYLNAFSPYYFTTRHESPWGAGINLDGDHALQVREFLAENALHWVHEYHLDGLRLDATHAMHDDSRQHYLAELTGRVHDSISHRQVLLIAEDHRNLAKMVRPVSGAGWGIDAVWADDFHHQMRRHLAGDADGYYKDFYGTTDDIATTIRQGWFFTGQHSDYLGEARGTEAADVPANRFVVCLQNHDQIGNRAFGDRLHHRVDPAAFRAASTLLLMLPETPLLFMGQEWAASSPFQFFTDHHAELGRLVTEGRRKEFQRFSAFSDPVVREKIPNPQAQSTFAASRLDWGERDSRPHANMLALYTALLSLRRRGVAFGDAAPGSFDARAPDPHTVVIRRATSRETLVIVARFGDAGAVDLGETGVLTAEDRGRSWTCLLSSEDSPFTDDSMPPVIEPATRAPVIRFRRASAVILKTDGTART